MNLKQNKVFERPAGGSYLGTIIDVVEMPQQKTVYKGIERIVDKVRVLWVLAYMNGAPYLDKEGVQMTIAGFYTASVSETSKLTKALAQILSGQVPVLQSVEELEALLLGRSNSLFITQEPDQKNPKELYSAIAGIAPMPPGVVAPKAPQGFVRAKDKPKEQAGPQG